MENGSGPGPGMADIHAMIVGEIPRLRRYARFLMRDSRQADDLVQDCLAHAIPRLAAWRPDTNMRAWLFVIMHGEYVGHWKQQQPSAAAILSNNDDNRPGIRDVQDALVQMDDEHQQILFMVSVDGLRCEDVAQALGLPVEIVQSRLASARDALRMLMEDALPGRFDNRFDQLDLARD